MTKRYTLVVIMVLLLILLVGCGGNSNVSSSSVVEPVIVKDDILVYISSEDNSTTGDLYIILENEERKRIASNVIDDSFVFLAESKALLYIDNENTLYYQSDEGEKVTITNEVIPYSLMVSEDESTFTYLKGDSWELYVQHIVDGVVTDRIRVDSDIYIGKYSLSKDGSILLYIDDKNTLYLKEGIESSRRIASNVYDAFITEDNHKIGFLNDKKEFYIRKVDEDDNRKIPANDVINVSISKSNRSRNIAYLADFSLRNYKGELHIIEGDESPRWLASDVIRYATSDDVDIFYFINDDNSLFYRDIKDSTNTLIATDVYTFIPDFKSGDVIYITDNDTMYLGGKDKDKKRIAGNLVDYIVADAKIYYTNDDEELYVYEYGKDTEKIASSVKYFTASENNTALAYYNEDKEIYIISNNKKENPTIKNANKYSKVYISNQLLFEKLLGLNDLIGIWKDAESNFIIEITREGTFIGYDYEGKFEIPIRMQGHSETSGTLEANFSQAVAQYYNGEYMEQYYEYADGYEDFTYIEIVSKDEILLEGDKLTRTNRETLNKKIEEWKEEIEYQAKLNEIWELGYNLWHTWVEIPVGTEVREEARLNSNLLGELQYTDNWYVSDYHIDDELRLWVQIEIFDSTTYSYMYPWILYNF